MRVIISSKRLLRTLTESEAFGSENARSLRTGYVAIDEVLPAGRFAMGAMHEMLSAVEPAALLFPSLVAKAAQKQGLVVWSDPVRELYAPGLAAMGLDLARMLILRPSSREEELWAAAECLRCKAVAACVLAPARLSRTETRRLQLAAERGGSLGLLLRPMRALRSPYAAVTRWIVRTEAGERTIQRCSIELIHGHGGRVGQCVLLETCRETHHVRAIEAMAYRQDRAKTIPASA